MTTNAELKWLAEGATAGEWAWTNEDLDRFWSKTKRAENGCLVWMASSSGWPGRKYGCFSILGKPIKAHRFSLLVKQGYLTAGKMACHTCDNSLCVEADHLYEGTGSQNIRDAVERGRHSNGQRSKTVCANGHPYADWNTYEYRGQRQCRICRNVHRGRAPMNGLSPPRPTLTTGEGE